MIKATYLHILNLLSAFNLYQPRQHGIGGFLLPSARFVSNNVHRGIGPEMREPGITLLLMQWGQFTDHDIVLTPIPKGRYSIVA